MTDYREQAIHDYSEWSKLGVGIVRQLIDMNASVNYAVAQREARLRLEEAMGDAVALIHECASDTAGTPSEKLFQEKEIRYREALDAVREK